MSTEKISIQKLKGAINYEVWALRTKSLLTKEGLIKAITDGPPISCEENDKALANLRLLLEDGPLLQIQHIPGSLLAWQALENLYSPKGFTSEFLTCKDFFETTLEKYGSMEPYVNRVKQLSDQLKAKDLELPNKVIIAWVLYSLPSQYDGLVGNITQSLRNNAEAYSLETLFSNLLDEAKRIESKDSSTQALYTTSTSTRGYI
jgi:hypothetical protein